VDRALAMARTFSHGDLLDFDQLIHEVRHNATAKTRHSALNENVKHQ
jgi:hypothetical protein